MVKKTAPVPPGTYRGNIKSVVAKGNRIQVQLQDITPLEEQDSREYTGSSVSYYTVPVVDPTTEGREAYLAECNDIIEALELDYAEGNVLKAIWRIAAARKGLSKKGYADGVYDAEKIVFFGGRILLKEQAKAAP